MRMNPIGVWQPARIEPQKKQDKPRPARAAVPAHEETAPSADDLPPGFEGADEHHRTDISV